MRIVMILLMLLICSFGGSLAQNDNAEEDVGDLADTSLEFKIDARHSIPTPADQNDEFDKRYPCFKGDDSYGCRKPAAHIELLNDRDKSKADKTSAIEALITQMEDKQYRPFKFVGFTINKVKDNSFETIEGSTDNLGKLKIIQKLDSGAYLLKVKTNRCACSQAFDYTYGYTSSLTVDCC